MANQRARPSVAALLRCHCIARIASTQSGGVRDRPDATMWSQPHLKHAGLDHATDALERRVSLVGDVDGSDLGAAGEVRGGGLRMGGSVPSGRRQWRMAPRRRGRGSCTGLRGCSRVCEHAERALAAAHTCRKKQRTSGWHDARREGQRGRQLRRLFLGELTHPPHALLGAASARQRCGARCCRTAWGALRALPASS